MSLVTIDEPAEGELTAHSVTVRGRAWECENDIQILVLSADGKWYQQKRADRVGFRWQADVKVGYENPQTQEYTVAVLADGPRLPFSEPLEALPVGYLIQTVSIRRR